jgi:hypothetical protein
VLVAPLPPDPALPSGVAPSEQPTKLKANPALTTTPTKRGRKWLTSNTDALLLLITGRHCHKSRAGKRSVDPTRGD